MIYAIVPAGGKSSRMGKPKLTLPFGSSTVLQKLVQTLTQAGLQRVLVVANPSVPELVKIGEAAGALVYLLDEETPDMRCTVELGLKWIENRFQMTPADWWLLVPADHPCLEAEVIRTLLHASQSQQGSIFIPTFQGRRGHPTLLSWRHVEQLRKHPKDVGLNVFIRQQIGATREIPVESPRILIDLDTPEDYQRILELADEL